jgi:hypothetical protein
MDLDLLPKLKKPHKIKFPGFGSMTQFQNNGFHWSILYLKKKNLFYQNQPCWALRK